MPNPHNGHRHISQFVAELRTSPPTMQELPFDPTPTDLARAHATHAARLLQVQSRMADALESIEATMVLILRQRYSAGVPWPAFVSVLVFSAIAIGVLLSRRYG